MNGLSGVAPRAWLGNYRVFTVPTPIGHVANTPEIVAAFEAAVADGMDVINFSGGGPQTDPANDAMIETIQNVVAAGVVPVIAAGNDRDDFGAGTVGSPGSAPDAITVAAVSNSVVYLPDARRSRTRTRPASVQAIPFQSTDDAPASWATVDQTLVDVTSIIGDGRQAGRARTSAAPPPNPNGADTTLPAGSLDGHDRARLARHSAPSSSRPRTRRRPARSGSCSWTTARVRPNPIPAQLSIPSGMISDFDGAQLRAYLATHGGKAKIRAGGDPQQIATGRSGVITSFSSAGPTEWGHMLKPDISAPGGQILSSTLPEFATLAVRRLRRHQHGDAARRRRGRAPAPAALRLDAAAGQVGADVDRRPRLGRTRPARSRRRYLEEGGGLADLNRATDPRLFTDARIALVSRT